MTEDATAARARLGLPIGLRPVTEWIYRGSLWRPLRSQPVLIVAALIWIMLVAWAIVPGVIAPSDPLTIHSDAVLLPPSIGHPFGTDQYGRDVLGQVIHGTGATLLIGLVSTSAAAAAGTLLGVVAGFLGGVVDSITMRLIDVLLCFPGILLALVFQAGLGPGRINVIIAVAIAGAPIYARLVRGSTISLRSRTFVLAARSAGVRESVILGRHVLPFLVGPVLSLATIGLGTATVLGAALSYLGLGGDEEIRDWGLLIGSGQAFMGSAWWIVTFPGLMITVVVMSAGVLGDAIGRRLGEGAS